MTKIALVMTNTKQRAQKQSVRGVPGIIVRMKLPAPMQVQVDRLAGAENRSRNNMLQMLLREALEARAVNGKP